MDIGGVVVLVLSYVVPLHLVLAMVLVNNCGVQRTTMHGIFGNRRRFRDLFLTGHLWVGYVGQSFCSTSLWSVLVPPNVCFPYSIMQVLFIKKGLIVMFMVSVSC